MSLTRRFVKAISWNVSANIANYILNIAIVAILARLLSPKDFGLLGLSTAFMWFIPLLRDIGLSTAVIQKKPLDQSLLSSVFWFQIILGFFCGAVIIVLSPFAALFFKEPLLKSVMMAFSIGVIFDNLGSLQEAILVKSLNFKPIAIRDIIANFIGGGGGIACAFLGLGVWSLVIRTLATSLSRSILLWMLAKWRPSFKVSIDRVRPLMSFAMNKTIQRLIFAIKGRLDFFLIGKFLGAHALGYYMIAFNLAARPNSQISLTISRVAFPALSHLQDDLARFRSAYLKILKNIGLIGFPILMGMFVMSPEIILVIYGPKWAPSIAIVQVLCFWSILNIIAQPAGTVFFALGRARIAARWELVQAIIMIPSLCIGVQWGIIGVAWSWVISWMIIFPINQYLANHMMGLNFLTIYNKLKFPLMVGITMISFVYVLKVLIMNLFSNIERLNLLVICVLSGAVFYLATYLVFEEKNEIAQVRQYILSIIK